MCYKEAIQTAVSVEVTETARSDEPEPCGRKEGVPRESQQRENVGKLDEKKSTNATKKPGWVDELKWVEKLTTKQIIAKLGNSYKKNVGKLQNI